MSTQDPPEKPRHGTSAQRARPVIATVRTLLPGLAIAVVALVVALVLSDLAVALSPIVVAVGLGILARNLGAVPSRADPGLTFTAQKVLRIGVVLLGFRLAFGDLLDVGISTLVVVLGIVASTLLFTYWLGRRLSLPPSLALLTGTGFAICGATAVAAMREVIDADDDAPAFAIALVTIFGTLSIVALPLIGRWIDLSAIAFGQWAGTAVHDVGQVVATAATSGDEALALAVVVKLARVLMLGPAIVAIGILWHRRSGVPGARASVTTLVPPFIVAFVLAVILRTSGIVPDTVLAAIRTAEGWLLTAALFGLGTGVRVRGLLNLGARAFAMGLIAFVFVAGLSLLGVVVIHGDLGP